MLRLSNSLLFTAARGLNGNKANFSPGKLRHNRKSSGLSLTTFQCLCSCFIVVYHAKSFKIQFLELRECMTNLD